MIALHLIAPIDRPRTRDRWAIQPTTITGTYNDKNQVVFNAQKVAIAGDGCSVTGTAKVTGTFEFTPGFAAAP